jgi:hypothetical protein
VEVVGRGHVEEYRMCFGGLLLGRRRGEFPMRGDERLYVVLVRARRRAFVASLLWMTAHCGLGGRAGS